MIQRTLSFTNMEGTSLLNVFDHCYLLYATHLMANVSRAKSTVSHSDRFCIIIIITMTCTPCRWAIWQRIWPCFHHLCNQHPLELLALFQCSIIIESTTHPFISIISFPSLYYFIKEKSVQITTK